MNMLTDPAAPHRLADPTDFERALMQAATDWHGMKRAATERGATAPHDDSPLLRLIPDVSDLPHAAGGLSPYLRDTVERVVGRPIETRPPLSDGTPIAPNPAAARAALSRWAARWDQYLRS